VPTLFIHFLINQAGFKYVLVDCVIRYRIVFIEVFLERFMKKPIMKGYYGSIFFEFVLQDRVADAIILLPDFPSQNNYHELIEFFYEKGYHVFVPRYRGTYQSNGVFLSKDIADDIIYFVNNLDRGEAKNLADSKKINFRINKKVLIADSFGASFACGAVAKDLVSNYLILVAPIWDFNSHNKEGNEENLESVMSFVSKTYKNCYRFKPKDAIKKLLKFKKTRPEFYISRLNDAEIPVLVMHDPNDKKVSIKNTQEKLKELNKATFLEHYFGNGLNVTLFNSFWKEIDKFIKINYVSD